MPRPRKPRFCACPIRGQAFKPAGRPLGMVEQIPLGHDELEALRLCDLLNLTQEEAGERMGVSRGTIQRTVKAARAKVVRALLEGAALVLDARDTPGGNQDRHDC